MFAPGLDQENLYVTIFFDEIESIYHITCFQNPPIMTAVGGCTNSTRSSQSYGSTAESGQGTGTIV